MPDAARKWLDKYGTQTETTDATFLRHRLREAVAFLRRLLEQNERLVTERDSAEKKMMDCLHANSKLGDAYRVLQADRDALVAYLRALLPAVNPALQFVQLRGMKPDLKEAHELYQALSDETRAAIEAESE